MAQPGNLLSDNNESVETSVAGWAVGAACTVAQSATRAYLGTNSLLATSTSATAPLQFNSAATSDQPSGLTVGATYDTYCWVFTTVSGRTAFWNVDWRTSGNVYISTSDQSGSPVSLVANQWTLVPYKTVAAPATTTQCTLLLAINQSATSEQYFVDSFFFGTVRPRIPRTSNLQSIVRSNSW